MSKLERSLQDERLTALTQLERVHGIGPVFAKKLYDEHGVRTLSDLLGRQELLNEKQVVGLKYVKDFETKIPRQEMQDMERLLTVVAAHVSPKLMLTICGSYRRGLPESGDIDVMLTHPDFVRLALQ